MHIFIETYPEIRNSKSYELLIDVLSIEDSTYVCVCVCVFVQARVKYPFILSIHIIKYVISSDIQSVYFLTLSGITL